MVADKGISVNVNTRLPYDLRLKASLYGLNISEITRTALRTEIEYLEILEDGRTEE